MNPADLKPQNAQPGIAPAAPIKFSRLHIAKSVLSNWSGLTVNVLVAFWMLPFVVHHLGDNAYGIWALVLQLTGYLGVVDSGLRSALVRYISLLHAQKDETGLNRLLSSTITLYTLIAPLCILGGILLAVVVLPRMQIPADMLVKAQITAVIASGILACDFVFATYHAGLAGFSRWDLTNAVSIAVILLRTALIVWLLEVGFGLVTLAILQLATTFLAYIAEIILFRRLVPTFR